MRSLVWFKRDLRINDNAALYHGAKFATNGVVGLFIITPQQWIQHNEANCKVNFWLQNLEVLSQELGKLNIPLLIKQCNTFQEVSVIVTSTAKENTCSKLFFNKEYEVNETRRDLDTTNLCAAENIDAEQFHDRPIVPPDQIQTKDGRYYSVFTPYKKVWKTKFQDYCDTFPKPEKQAEIEVESSKIPTEISGFKFLNNISEFWEPGEKAAWDKLKQFSVGISKYDNTRDIPMQKGTSLLSPYLAAGVLSARRCLGMALDGSDDLPTGQGALTWISELVWRDFYIHILVGFPKVSMNQPFKEYTNNIPWRSDSEELTAWKNGETGYPIVDAGMRQLNQTGWMHNRLRMITAMFLTKNLLIDWRLGEQYFMEKLIDGDLAANNGGWQWSASTGTDSVPYFRIFNPFSQSKRFDSEGQFIKEMCPELEPIPANKLHDPIKLTKAIEEHNVSYPEFIVNYKMSRERALSSFKSLKTPK